jgi:hypothetical protein
MALEVNPDLPAPTEKLPVDDPAPTPGSPKLPAGLVLATNERSLGISENVTVILTNNGRLDLFCPGTGKMKFLPKLGMCEFLKGQCGESTSESEFPWVRQ